MKLPSEMINRSTPIHHPIDRSTGRRHCVADG